VGQRRRRRRPRAAEFRRPRPGALIVARDFRILFQRRAIATALIPLPDHDFDVTEVSVSVVEDANFLSGRRPGDACLFAKRFAARLGT
jgi:hypothetical protein